MKTFYLGARSQGKEFTYNLKGQSPKHTNGAECSIKHPAPISLTPYAKRITSILTHLYIGPYPIHDVVVTAVSAAVSAATITFATTSQNFLSFINF